MIPDLSPILERYEALRAESDALFQLLADKFPDEVRCKRACSDCCNALFDLSLVEALYLKRAFDRAFGHGRLRSDILTRASTLDRELTRLKREMFRAEKAGENPAAIMARAATFRLPCPLLGEDGLCLLYEARPITCRLYGIPTAIAGQSHVCGFSGFDKGSAYPTVRLEKIQNRLDQLSKEITQTVNSRFRELHEVYVPLSMALLTDYNEEYLGIGEAKKES